VVLVSSAIRLIVERLAKIKIPIDVSITLQVCLSHFNEILDLRKSALIVGTRIILYDIDLVLSPLKHNKTDLAGIFREPDLHPQGLIERLYPVYDWLRSIKVAVDSYGINLKALVKLINQSQKRTNTATLAPIHEFLQPLETKCRACYRRGDKSVAVLFIKG
jgi:hypothetical protein